MKVKYIKWGLWNECAWDVETFVQRYNELVRTMQQQKAKRVKDTMKKRNHHNKRINVQIGKNVH